MSISGILESLATYYKERMFGKIHELTFNTENALFDSLTVTNRPPCRKAILEAVCLDLSRPLDEQPVVPFTLNSKPTSLFLLPAGRQAKREQKKREFSGTPVPGHWDSIPVSTVYNVQHSHNQGALDSITITFPQYGGSQPGLAKYDYRHGIADIHISGPDWKSIKIMAGSSYIVTEYNIPDPEPHGLNHIVWQTDAGRALPFLKSQDLVIIILLESSAGLMPPNLQLSFNIVELDNPVNTEVSHVPFTLNSRSPGVGLEFLGTPVPLHWDNNPVHTVNKPETMLAFPVLTMDTYESVLTGANPQNIRLPFNHPVLSMSIQVVDIPIKSVVFIPFPFDDKRNYKIPLEFNKNSGNWEIVFQNPVAPMDEFFSDKTTINFSKLTNPEPVLVITPDIADEPNHNWQVNIWVCQRNICRVMSGMAGLAFMG